MILDEFQIKEKVVLFVTDNEPKMKAAFKDDERSGDGPHILHKSVFKGLDEVVPIKNLVEKVRKISKRHNKSYALRYGLQEQQKMMDIKVRPLHQDVPTRWGSAKTAFESFLDYKDKWTFSCSSRIISKSEVM